MSLKIINSYCLTEYEIKQICGWVKDIDIKSYLYLSPPQILNILQTFQQNLQTFCSIDEEQNVVCVCWICNNQISYMCNPQCRKQNYATITVQQVLKNCSNHYVEAHIDSRNLASQRVAEKCGFIKDPIRIFYPDRIMYKYIYIK